MIKAIIFDAFDVLISDGVRGTARKLASEMGLVDWLEFFQQSSFWLENWQKLWLGEMSEKEMEKGLASQLGKEKARQFFAGWRDLTKADKRMVNLVKRLKRKKEFRLGLLVNTPPQLLEYLRREIPLDLFDETVFSCEIGLMKPDQKIFKIMAKRLKVKMKECLFIDDGQKNVEAAERLGMSAIQFKDQPNLEKELKKEGLI